MSNDPRYSLVIRTPEAQARADRRQRVKRLATVAALIVALLTPGRAGLDDVAPALCHHTWIC